MVGLRSCSHFLILVLVIVVVLVLIIVILLVVVLVAIVVIVIVVVGCWSFFLRCAFMGCPYPHSGFVDASSFKIHRRSHQDRDAIRQDAGKTAQRAPR